MFLKPNFIKHILLLFFLHHASIAGNKQCGKQSHKGKTGTLLPKDGMMGPGTKCVWEIMPIEPGPEIYLLFEKFNLAPTDTVWLKNGTSESAPDIFGPLNGTLTRLSFLSGTKTLTVVVEISSSPNFNRHFRAYFDASRCGKDLQDNTGHVQSPLYANNRNDLVSCTWRFNQSEMIGISFKTFSLEKSTLHVQGSKESDGDYTEGHQPSDVFTQQYALISLDLVTSSLTNLEFVFVPISSECSTHITLKEGQPYSLELPTETYSSYNCRWIFEAPSSSNISLKLEDLKFNENDFVIINNGNSEFSPKLEIFTSDSKETEKSIESSQNFLWVAFITDFLLPNIKFKATVSTIKLTNFLTQDDLPCGKTFFNDSYSNFGPEYGMITANSFCIWHIKPNLGNFIYVRFISFSLKKGDKLLIINESNSKQVIFGPFTYKNKPSDLLVPSCLAIMLNVSNTLLNISRSFNGYYAVDSCGYQIESEYGYLSSPKYISLSGKGVSHKPLYCNWLVMGSKMIKISFESFKLPNSKFELETSFGNMALTGSELPSDMLLLRNAALTLYLNTLYPNQSLNFTFFPVEPTCSQMVELNPTYPNHTFSLFLTKFKNYNCALIIYSPLNTIINFLIIELKLGEMDILTIKDGPSASSSPILDINKYSQSHFINHLYNTSRNGLLLDFSTPLLESFVEVHISFSYGLKTILENKVLHPKPCGKQQHSGQTGALNPYENKLPPNMPCKWIITPPNIDDDEIYLRFDLINLFPKDVVKIINGTDEGGPLIFQPFYGIITPFTVLTGVHNLTLLVHTDNTPGDRPFKATYTTLGCGKDIQDEAGMILSPLYSDNRSNRVVCSWRFNVTDREKLVFESMHIDPHKSKLLLNNEALNLNNTLEDEFVEPFSTLTLSLDTSVPNQTMHVSFYKVTLECSESQILTEFKPSFDLSLPSSPFHDVSCNWILLSPPNTTLGLVFTSFKLGLMDSVIIKDGSSENSKTLYYLTFNNDVNITYGAFRTSQSAISIQFLTQYLYPDTQLAGKVFIDKHGGYFKNEGTIEIYNSSLYLLEVDENLEVLVTLTKPIPNQGCLFIYSDFSFSSQLIRGICSNSSDPAPLISPNRKMMIFPNFSNDADTSVAEFKGIPKGCFTVSTSNSGSYSLLSLNNQNCSWVITVKDESSIISLQFTTVNTPAKLFTLIGETLITELKENMPIFYIPSGLGVNTIISPQSLTETSNGMIQGFYNILPKCELLINDTLLNSKLFSPNYPNAYPLFADCWTKFNSKLPTYLVLLDLNLSPGHTLEVYSKNKKMTFSSDSSILEDVILESPASIHFSSGSCTKKNCHASTLKTGSGYLLNATSLSCGGLKENTEGSFSSPSSLSPPFKCLWILKVPSGMVNFTLHWSDGSAQEHPGFKIHDGPSLKDKIMDNTTVDTYLLSRNTSLVFVYESMPNISSYPTFKVIFHQEECTLNYTMCTNGLCMHPDWICNDQNDCGDWSDERYCNTTWPSPPPRPSPPPVVDDYTTSYTIGLGLGVPIALLLGLAVGLYIPKAIERWRAWRTDGFSLIVNT